MKSFITRYGGLKFLTILVFVLAVCGIVVAENANDANEKADKQEVLAPLEKQMQTKISVAFAETPIDDVIRAIAEKADVDIIKSPQVTGTVTATLTDVPLVEALDNILAAHGYGYVADKNVIRIAPVAELAQKAEALVSRIYRITYADITDIEKTLEKFISQRGSISASASTSNIIVTDTESKIKAMDTFIAEIDRMTPQILVEVRIYDITAKDTLDLGIEWAGNRRTTIGSSLGEDPTAGKATPFLFGAFSGAVDKTADTTDGILRFGFFNKHVDLDVQLRAEMEDINAKLLANPRILVLDNEKAVFDIVREIPYIEQSTTGSTITDTIKFKLVGTKLEVTPHVTRNGMLRLHIMPEFGVQVGSTSPPTVDTRKVDTIALVKDGQTVVIGGLRKKDVTQQVSKIPLLGDIPLVGALFRFEGEETVNSEIVVFITPYIINQLVLSQAEQQAYKETEFSRPEPTLTRAEKSSEEKTETSEK